MDISARLQYASFLVRMWRVYQPDCILVEWESEVEHIQSGETWKFHTLAALQEFLHPCTVETAGIIWTEVSLADQGQS